MRQLDGYMLWLGHFGDVADTRIIIETGILVVVDLARGVAGDPAARSHLLSFSSDRWYGQFRLSDPCGRRDGCLLLAIEYSYIRLLQCRHESLTMHRGSGNRSGAGMLFRRCAKTRVKLGAYRRIARSMGGCPNCSRLIPSARSPCRTPNRRVPTARAQPFCRPVWRLLQVTPSRRKHSSGLAKSRSSDLTAVTSCNRMPVTSCN